MDKQAPDTGAWRHSTGDTIRATVANFDEITNKTTVRISVAGFIRVFAAAPTGVR
jgi:hypothetical protein